MTCTSCTVEKAVFREAAPGQPVNFWCIKCLESRRVHPPGQLQPVWMKRPRRRRPQSPVLSPQS